MTDPSAHRSLRSVELHILLSVVDRARHGYAILQEAEARTGGRPGFEIPTLYRAIRRLRDETLIRAAEPLNPDPTERREYWEATDLGRQVLAAELLRLEVALTVGRERLGQATAGGKT